MAAASSLTRWAPSRRVKAAPPGARPPPSRPPLEYARWFYYDTMLLFAPAVRYLADVMGGQRVLLGSDYPFDVGDGDPAVVVREAHLDAGTEQAVLGDTCCGLF